MRQLPIVAIRALLVALLIGLSFAEARADPIDDALAAIDSGDFKKAMSILTPLAAAGNADAQHNLGAIYATGSGVPRDFRLARDLFERAAAQNHRLAQNSLGLLYARGEGVQQSFDVALVWFNLSAANGEPEAAKNAAAIASQMTPPQITSAQQTAERRRGGSGFSTVEAEVLLVRGVSI